MKTSLLVRRRLLGGGFSPQTLFALSEPGFWYDPSDLTTLFKDTAGTQPVTTPGDTVALMLDKRQGLVLGPELVTNGDFSNGTTGWTGQLGGTLTVSSGALRVTNSAAFSGRATSPITTVVGVRYKVSVDFINSSNGTIAAGASNSADGTSAIAVSASNILGRVDFSFLATATTTYIVLYVNSTVSGYWAEFDNISVRELPGFHATQSTTANRPTYGIVPKTGRRNLLTFTEQFDNAAWVKNGLGVALAPTVTANFALSPLGDVSAERVQFSLNGGTTSTDQSLLRQTVSGLSTVDAFAFSFYARATDGVSSYAMIAFGKPSASQSITVTGQWQRFVVSGAGANTNYSLMLRGGQTPTNSNTADILIWGAQLEVGSTATAYQRVTTQFDVTEAGVASDHYLFFGGSTDPRWMITPTITPGTDKVQVFAGVRKLSDAAAGMLVELSSAVVSNAGSFAMIAPASAAPNYMFRSRGSASQVDASYTDAVVAAPVTNVLTGVSEIAADVLQLRVNGAQATQSTADQGTGNFLAYPAYIGARAGSSLYLNAQLFQLIGRFGPNLPTPTTQQTERFVAEKTPEVTL